LDTSKLSTGDMIAGAGGILLIISLFLPWYGIDINVTGIGSASGHASGWETLSFIDILLFLIAVLAILYAVGAAAGALPPDAPAATVVMGAGAFAVLLILLRIIDLPTPDVPDIVDDSVDFSRQLGIFVGLISAAGITYGGWRSANESPTSGPAVPPEPTPSPPAA
jgi:hypothetical protein